MKVKLPDGRIVTGVDEAAVLVQLTAMGIKDVVLVRVFKGTNVEVIEE